MTFFNTKKPAHCLTSGGLSSFSCLTTNTVQPMAKVHKSYLTADVRRAERTPIKSTPNVLFISLWSRKSESRKKAIQKKKVIIRLTYRKEQLNFSTGVECMPNELDREKFAIKNNQVATLMLQDLKAKLQSAFAEMRLTGRKIDLRAIWQVANGQALNANTPTVSVCLDMFFDQIKTQYQAGEFTRTVVEKVITWNQRIKDYITGRYGPGAELDHVAPADAKRFMLYLKTEHQFSHNYAAGIVQHFKRVLNYAVENEWIIRNPFMNYRRKLEKIRGEILTESEMNAIQGFELFAPTLDHIRQAFLFQCYTGLSYAELVRVTTAEILNDEKTGRQFIFIHRQKTGVPSLVPLNEEAYKIICLFDNHPLRIKKGLLVPIISNQKYNQYLKQLAGVMNLKKRLTSHCARRTAATLYLNKGAAVESVSAMLGHTNTVTTQRSYAIINPERVINDFLNSNIKIRKAQ